MITKEQLHKLINKRDVTTLKQIFSQYNVIDLSEVVAQLESDDILWLLRMLEKNISGIVFSYFSIEDQQRLIESFTKGDIQTVLNELYSDDINELLGELPANLVKKVLTNATADQRKEINLLLSYPESSAGSIMSTDFVELKQSDTMKQAIAKIKRQGQVAEVITDSYVINDQRVLVGAISLQHILFEDDQTLVGDIMEETVVSVSTHDDQEEVLRVMRKYDLMVVPVVNDDHCLIGIITIDDIMDIIREEVTEDIQKRAAISPTTESYLQTSVFQMTLSRVPWLMLLMVASIFTEFIIGRFEHSLDKIAVLAAFIPMVMGTAGNAGNQAAVMIIRGISVDDLTVKDSFKVLVKECKVSIIMGLILFAVTFARIMILPPNASLSVALCIGLSIMLSLFNANIIGGILPIVSLALKQDPAAMAAPLITNIVDIVSLLIYFMLAIILLGI